MNPSAPAYYSTFHTPMGRFSVAVDGAGAVVAAAFGGAASLAGRFAPTRLVPDESRTRAARSEIRAYFRGLRRRFTVRTAPTGTPFQRRVWAKLHRISFGRTRSYGQIARELRTSARAVGRANATNPVCLITPCHRVIGADGSLTGFAFGVAIKRRLLAFEGRRRTP